MREAITGTGDRLYVELVLRWISKAGPFWEEDRFPQPDDYFQFEDIDVTDQGLGEASRRLLGGLAASVYSFTDDSQRFKATPITVTHGLEDAPFGDVEIANHWMLEQLEKAIDSRPTSWKQLLDKSSERFNLLRISPAILSQLEGQPFHRGVVDRLMVLLEVLQTLAHETRPDQSFSEAGLELWQKHTTGDKAWFTDESAAAKVDFKTELTFTDSETGKKISCPWHGKVKPNQFRIHFEWPRPEGQRIIKVVYIGPKISRR